VVGGAAARKLNMTQQITFKRYVGNGLWLMSDAVLRMGLSLVVGVLVARYLAPTGMGQLSYAVSFAMLFGAFGSFGLRKVLVRELVARPEDAPRVQGSAMVLSMGGFVISVSLILLVGWVLGHGWLTTAMILVVAIATGLKMFQGIEASFHGKTQSRYVAVARVIASLINSDLRLLLIVAGAGVFWFTLAWPLEALVIGAVLAWFYRKRGVPVRSWRFDGATARRLARSSAPLMFSALAVSAYARIDQVMIGQMLDDEQLGFYAVGVRLVSVLYILPSAMSTTLLPALMRARNRSDHAFGWAQRRYYDLSVLVSVSMAVALTLAAEPLVVWLYGPAYRPAAWPLMVYAWSLPATFLGMASSQYLVASDKTWISLLRTAFGLAINVGMNLWLIPRYGIAGAAWATVVSYTTATFLLAVSPTARHQAWWMLRSIATLGAGLVGSWLRGDFAKASSRGSR